MATVPNIQDAAAERRDALVEQIVSSASTAMQLFTIYLGDQLGLYDVLAADGPMNATQLARRTGTAPRYVREWLEQQSVAGILEVENPDDAPERRRFYLPAGHDEVLADRESLNYLAPLPQVVAGAVAPIQQLLSAWRNGIGVPYEAYGRTFVEGQARMNRAAFLHQLAPEWLPVLPGWQKLLQTNATVRVADIGCGAGWSSIGMALHCSNAEVHGFDFDASSIELAKANAAEFGVSDRVTFQVRDASDSEVAGNYDLVMALECVHDMSNPVAALQTMRRLVRPDGYVLVVDERVADRFVPRADGLESLMYGFSVLHCLPVGMAEQPSAATGTVMRCETLVHYATQAGFGGVELLPIDHPMFRFYWLKQ
ncbi:MAG TPA: class I SAM-dependent methyltransferase [Terriglobales bacterium]|nr:class I SAM-dependent methyltransferase [Terriglobales bacterium]